jgi:CRISPR-associated protein Cmr2
VLTGDEHSRQKNGYKLIAGLKPFELLVAEYKKSRKYEVSHQEIEERVGKYEISHQEVEERVGKMVRVCRVRKGDTGQEQIDTLNIAGAMLVRFLATKGRGVER